RRIPPPALHSALKASALSRLARSHRIEAFLRQAPQTEKRRARLLDRTRLVDLLAEEVFYRVEHVHGHVEPWIAAASIGTYRQQILMVAIRGQELAHHRGCLTVLGGRQRAHQPA